MTRAVSRRDALRALGAVSAAAAVPATSRAQSASSPRPLDGRAALVTGAARGIGRATALALAREGADVLALDVARPIPEVNYPLASPADLDETRRLVEGEGRRCLAVQADVRDYPALQRAASQATALGPLAVVVANAAVTVYDRPLAEVTSREFQTVVDVNLVGAANTLRAVAPHLAEGARVVAVSSLAGRTGAAGLAHYSASKWGLFGLAKSAALEWAARGVTVNVGAPGPVDTPLADNEAVYRTFLPDDDTPTQAEMVELLRAQNPMGVPWLEPGAVAATILFFTTEAARHITGSAFEVGPGGAAQHVV